MLNSSLLQNFPKRYLMGEGVLFLMIFLYIATKQSVKVIYAAPVVVLFIDYVLTKLRSGQHFEADRGVAGSLFIYAAMFIPAVTFNINTVYKPLAIRDILIISAPFVIFLKSPSFTEASVKRLFIVFFISFLLFGGNYQHVLETLKGFNLLYLIMPQRTSLEFDLGAVFGLFALFFFYRKRWFWLLMCFLVIFLAGKRVILFAMIPAVAIHFLLLARRKTTSAKLGVLAFIFISGAIASLTLPEIVGFISKKFGINIPIQVILMGRDKPIFYLRDGVLSATHWWNALWGYGPGMSDYLLGSQNLVSWAKGGISANPHNDFLKLMYDYGISGFLLYFFAAARTFAKTEESRLAWIYTMFVYSVDNSLIFIVYLIALGVISHTAPMTKDQHATTSEDITKEKATFPAPKGSTAND